MTVLVFFGHHKCASQYVKAVFSQVARRLGMSVGNVKSVEPDPDAPAGQHLNMWSGIPSAEVLCFDNATPGAMAAVLARSPYRGFHVIRDPRDILISGYFSHLYSHSTGPEHSSQIQGWRRQLAAVNDTEAGILLELEFAQENFFNLSSWDYANPCIYETRYEILIANPFATFQTIFEYLDIDIPHWNTAALVEFAWDTMMRRGFGRPQPRRNQLPSQALQRILQRNSYERLSGGRRQGQEDIHHHYRKGQPGDWRNYFTPAVKEAFKTRYAQLLVALDYEENNDW